MLDFRHRLDFLDCSQSVPCFTGPSPGIGTVGSAYCWLQHFFPSSWAWKTLAKRQQTTGKWKRVWCKWHTMKILASIMKLPSASRTPPPAAFQPQLLCTVSPSSGMLLPWVLQWEEYVKSINGLYKANLELCVLRACWKEPGTQSAVLG